MKKRIVATMLALTMVFSLTACGSGSGSSSEDSADVSTEKSADETAEVQNIADMSEDEIKAALQKEPAWGTTLYAEYDGGDCTCGPAMAETLGYFDEYGLDVEIVSGTEITEAIGTNKAQFGVHHIAHMLVPITNGVDLIFTGSAQTGCKSLYVKAGSGMKSTADLVGKTVGLDGPIGSSAHNMVIRFLLADGVNVDDVDCVQLEQSAAIQSLINGDVDAVMLSDRYAKAFVDDGTVEVVRSITWDDDFKDETCCVMAMNGSFVEKNPITAQVLTQCTMDAYMYIANNKEEAAKIMLDEKFVSGTQDLTEYMIEQQDWTVTYDATKATIEKVADDYINAGIITGDWTVDSVVEAAWHPLGTKK